MPKRILFYGASNVYGFDPRLNSNGRYPTEVIWPTLLANALAGEWEVVADGMNGRRIPNLKYERAALERRFERNGAIDVFAFMLGTNDILVSLDVDVSKVLGRGEAFVRYLLERKGFDILMIAPPWVGTDAITDPDFVRFREKNKQLNQGLKALAEKYAISFVDAQTFGVELCFDHVHFTEVGHRRFADEVTKRFLKEGYKGIYERREIHEKSN